MTREFSIDLLPLPQKETFEDCKGPFDCCLTCQLLSWESSMNDAKDSAALNLVVAADSPVGGKFPSEFLVDAADVVLAGADASFFFVPLDSKVAQVSAREVSVKCKHRQLATVGISVQTKSLNLRGDMTPTLGRIQKMGVQALLRCQSEDN